MTTCDEIRPLLPEHALAALGTPDELEVQRHLRGCAACRRELDALREGAGVFGSALARPAPPELHDRVLGALVDEWADGPARPERASAARWAWAAVASAIVLALAAGAFGLAQRGRAERAEADAGSYRTVLDTLGGTGFRVGTLEAAGATPVEGSVVAYESSHDQSFVVVFVRTPDVRGVGRIVVSRSDGTTWVPGRIEFDANGDAAAWWVSDRSITTLSGVSVRAPGGAVLASASLREA